MAKLRFSARDRLCLSGLLAGKLDDSVKVSDLRALAEFDLLSVTPDEGMLGRIVIALSATGIAYAKAIAAEGNGAATGSHAAAPQQTTTLVGSAPVPIVGKAAR